MSAPRAIEGLAADHRHICYGYGIKQNLDWKATLGSNAQYEASSQSSRKPDRQVSVEAKNSRVRMIFSPSSRQDVLSRHRRRDDKIETPEEGRGDDAAAAKFVRRSGSSLHDCGMRRCAGTSPSPSSSTRKGRSSSRRGWLSLFRVPPLIGGWNE